ncbi:MAG TPA: M28 family peptidase [Blastocatellia bacterium]|nr:M28 family peptidase [Blastocatellia bacterium]
MFIKVLLATVLFVVCPAFAQSPTSNIETITRKLTSAEFAGRASKTAGAQKAAEYISQQFSAAGLKPLSNAAPNVAAMIEGKSRKDEFVIVSAHYDGFGNGFAGAMDNAAGVAVMIEVAQNFLKLLAKAPPSRSVLFIAFDGGEQNNSGAKLYAERPLVPLDKTAAVINLAGFGAGFGDQLLETLYVVGAEFSPQLADAVTKNKRGDVSLAMFGDDVTRFAGAEHLHFKFAQLPAMTITNGIHYAYHSKADVPARVNFPALEKHAATLAKLIAEIANAPGKIERTAQPSYDADEASEWVRLLIALRENVIKVSANNAGQAQIDDVLLELKRFKGRAVQEAKAREAVILRAASICFYIANPNGVEYNSLLSAARNAEQSGNRQQAIAAYQRLLKFIEDEYRRDDQTVNEIRQRLAKLGATN